MGDLQVGGFVPQQFMPASAPVPTAPPDPVPQSAPDKGSGPGFWGTWGPTILGAGIGLAGSMYQNARQSSEAQKNRDFQAQMSDTAHQREVADLRIAGINPMWSATGGGSSTPSGSQAQVSDPGAGVSRGVASALAVKQAQANLALTSAQTDREASSALLTRVQAGDLQTQANSGRYRKISAEADLAEGQVKPLIDRAREEVRLTSNRADQAHYDAVLSRLSVPSAENVAAFQKTFGQWTQLGPAVSKLFDVLQLVKGTAVLPTRSSHTTAVTHVLKP